MAKFIPTPPQTTRLQFSNNLRLTLLETETGAQLVLALPERTLRLNLNDYVVTKLSKHLRRIVERRKRQGAKDGERD